MPGRRTQEAVAEAAPLEAARAATGTGAAAPGRRTRSSARSGAAGLLRLLVLHSLGGRALVRQPAHRARRRGHGGLLAVNPNTMYPLLRALEQEGLVAGEWEHPERRSRRFYRLTGAGRPSATVSPARRRRAWTPSPPRRALRRELGLTARVGRVRAQVDLPAWPARPRSSGTTRAAGRLRRRPQARRLGRGRLAARGRASSGTRTPAAAAASSSASSRYEARSGQEVEVEDEKIRGTQRVAFAPHEDGVVVTLELDYALKQDARRGAVVDLLFVRRPQRDSLQRTLRRFAIELRDELRAAARAQGARR